MKITALMLCQSRGCDRLLLDKSREPATRYFVGAEDSAFDGWIRAVCAHCGSQYAQSPYWRELSHEEWLILSVQEG